jgi:hypothetical protein
MLPLDQEFEPGGQSDLNPEKFQHNRNIRAAATLRWDVTIDLWDVTIGHGPQFALA